MFIKEVVICGFKSYKETTKVQNFNPGYNVVVGRNGSGKSNFFAALEFALRAESKSLKPEERNALLYHGQVSNTSAYVEVVFDNSDRKLPYNTDTVVFKRVVGTKKDRFYINTKESQNVKQFLDSAGITNSYYIVKQGKINEMTSANDKIRLQVLYDISGSKIYDEKKIKTRKMLVECRKKVEDVDKLIQSIDENLEGLEERSKELQKCLKLGKKKRAIEFLVYTREKESLTLRINQAKHEDLLASYEPLRECLQDLRSKIDHIEGTLMSLEQKGIYLESKKKDIESEIPVTSSRIAIAENKLQDTMDKYRLSLQSENNIRKAMESLDTLKKDLKLVCESITEIKNEETIAIDEHILSKAKMEKFKDQRGRTAQFSTTAERNIWISAEISKLGENLRSQNLKLQSHTESHAKIEDHIKVLTEQLEKTEEEWENHRIRLRDQGSSALNSRYNSLLEKRTLLWSDTGKIDQEINITKENISRFTDLLRKTGGNAVVTGWMSVQSILVDLRQNRLLEQKLKGYYGLVLDNITCDESRNVAVEVAAGTKMFYHVVESHEVSKIIMVEFNKRKLAGEINFIPLTEINVDERNYPQNLSDGTLLINEINYNENVSKAMKYIFGRTLLCKSLEAATRNAKMFKFNCVTTDGDKVLSKGPLTGGYYNRRTSKITLSYQLRSEMSKLENLRDEKKSKDEELLVVENGIKESNKAKETYKTSITAISCAFDKLQIQKDGYKRKIHDSQLQLQQEQRKSETVKHFVKTLTFKIENLQQELSEKMSSKSVQPRYKEATKNLQAELARDVSEKTQAAEVITSKRKEKEEERKKLEKSIVKTEKGIEDLILLENSARSLEKAQNELEKQLNDLHKTKRKLNKEWNDASSEYSANQRQVDQLKSEEDRLKEAMTAKKDEYAKVTHGLQKLFKDQSENRKNLDEVVGTILRLGTIPSDVTKYEDRSTNELCKGLKRISKEMRSLGKVNKNATEKFERVTTVKAELLEEKQKYDEIDTKIKELDKTLDDKKGDAVFNVFQTIHDQFREIFLKLVPHGNIRMFLRTTNGGQVNASAVLDEDGRRVIRDLFQQNKFEGMAIDVNFLGKSFHGTKDLRSLSGGQKSLISLALLLAIQRCDPVPLYIFDEIDQALDRKHRSAVASVIKEFSQNAQFICTTFSRQFIDKCDAAFGVFFRNQASKILPISVDEALSFVKSESEETSPVSSLGGESSATESSQNTQESRVDRPVEEENESQEI